MGSIVAFSKSFSSIQKLNILGQTVTIFPYPTFYGHQQGTMGRAKMTRHTGTSGRKHKQGDIIAPVATPSKQSKTKAVPVKTENKKKTPQCSPGQKRLRRWRAQPPQSFYEIYARAMSQRFFVLDRVPGGTVESPSETIKLAGSTGNVYSVFVGSQPACDCPHGQQGNQCKHWLYVGVPGDKFLFHFPKKKKKKERKGSSQAPSALLSV